MVGLDSNIFFQRAAAEQANANRFQQQLDSGLKMYTEGKKEKGLDVAKLAEAAAYKKASGLEVTPEEDALAKGWDKIQSTSLALDPLGRPYQKRQSIFGDIQPGHQPGNGIYSDLAAAAGQGYQPTYSRPEPVVSGGEADAPFPPGFVNGSPSDIPADGDELPQMTVEEINSQLPPQLQNVSGQGLDLAPLQNINQPGPIQDTGSVADSLGGRLDPNNPAVLEADIAVRKQMATDKAKLEAENSITEKKKAEGKKQLEGVLSDMRTAIGDLSATGEVVTTGGDKLKNVENYLKNSGMGQKYAGATGSAAQPPRDRFNSARNRLTTALMAATGMSSQQLNSNVELQEFLKSLGNTQMAPETVNSIIDNISRQYGNGPQDSPVFEDRKAQTAPKFPSTLEGKRVRNDQTGQVGVIRNGKWEAQ